MDQTNKHWYLNWEMLLYIYIDDMVRCKQTQELIPRTSMKSME